MAHMRRNKRRQVLLVSSLVFTALTPSLANAQSPLSPIEQCRSSTSYQDHYISCLETTILNLMKNSQKPNMATVIPPSEETKPAIGRVVVETEASDTPTGLGAEQVMARSKVQRKKQSKTQTRQAISAALTNFATDRRGKYIFFLDNGQIWKQKAADVNNKRLSKKRSYDAKVFRGAISGYRLSLTGVKRPFAVERIK